MKKTVIFILIIICLVAGYFFYQNKFTSQNDYYVLKEQAVIADYYYRGYYGGILKLRKEDNYVITDVKGNVLYDLSPNEYIVLSETFVAQKNEEDDTYDIYYQKNKIYSHVLYSLVNDNYTNIYNDEMDILVNDNNEVLLQDYDDYIATEYYILAFKEDVCDIYDNDLNLLLEAKKVKKMGDTYLMNDKYIVLEEDDKEQVYFVNKKKYSSLKEAVAINYDYVAFKENDAIKVYDEDNNLVETIKSKAKDFYLITKDVIGVVNHSCDTKDYKSFVNTYDKDYKVISTDCGQVYYNNHSTIVREDGLFYIYANDKLNFKLDGSKNAIVYEFEDNKYQYLNDDFSAIYDSEGKNVYPTCYDAYPFTSSIYRCSSNENINYLYKDDKLFLEDNYADITYNKGYFIVLNKDGYYGLYDIFQNKILEEKYDNIEFLDDNNLLYTYDNKLYIDELVKASKKEYLKFVKDIKEEESNKDEVIDNVKEVIANFQLEDNEKLIKENEELFQKYAYHILNNEALRDIDKKYLLKMFPAVVDMEKYNYLNLNNLLRMTDSLSVLAYDEKPDSMGEAFVGEYYLNLNYISILNEDYDYAMTHELMHFLSDSNTDKVDDIYVCDGKIKNYAEVSKLSFADQKLCENHYIKDSEYLEEAGAEFLSKVTYNDTETGSYKYTLFTYNLLLYVLDIDPKDLEYNQYRTAYLYQVLKDKGLSYKESKSLLEKLEKIHDLDTEDDKKQQGFYLYQTITDILKIYELQGKNWRENDYISALLATVFRYTPFDVVYEYVKESDVSLTYSESLKNIYSFSIYDRFVSDYPDFDKYYIDFMGNKIRFTIFQGDSEIKLDYLFDHDGKVTKVTKS